VTDETDETVICVCCGFPIPYADEQWDKWLRDAGLCDNCNTKCRATDPDTPMCPRLGTMWDTTERLKMKITPGIASLQKEPPPPPKDKREAHYLNLDKDGDCFVHCSCGTMIEMVGDLYTHIRDLRCIIPPTVAQVTV
jgi:hypothetical protein